MNIFLIMYDSNMTIQEERMIEVALKEAVELAAKGAQSGDVVTLSPACASFDAFVNFAARGNYFKELVNKL